MKRHTIRKGCPCSKHLSIEIDTSSLDVDDVTVTTVEGISTHDVAGSGICPHCGSLVIYQGEVIERMDGFNADALKVAF